VSLRDLISAVMGHSADYFRDQSIGPGEYHDRLHKDYTDRRQTERVEQLVSFVSGIAIGAIIVLALL
jgi:hypothetical protein